MWSWTRQSVAWYARAAEQSSYYADLARAMQPFINPDWALADMGCGLGFLSLELAGLAARIEAFDTDPLALRELERRVAARGIANIHPRLEDAMACTAFGGGKMLLNLDNMNDGMVNLARKRQLKA